MSKTFLELVAADLLSRFDKNMSRVAVVFPNKRASLFLNRHFFEMTGGEPMWTPAYMTISDLFRRHSLLTVADPIKLVCDLHKTYVECTKSKETIDHFYSWGQLMLSDFDDVDKNLADADKVFRNVADIAEIERDLTYLDEEKQAILTRKRGAKRFRRERTEEAVCQPVATHRHHLHTVQPTAERAAPRL